MQLEILKICHWPLLSDTLFQKNNLLFNEHPAQPSYSVPHGVDINDFRKGRNA